ncbi:MAG TPA: hypothetical protein VLM89_15055 [Phycisphaerae bacterium]|nr:hypothetical protein [Phycisphaerae bacterium]
MIADAAIRNRAVAVDAAYSLFLAYRISRAGFSAKEDLPDCGGAIGLGSR